MKSNWKKCKLGDVAKINQNTLSKKDEVDRIIYLDTGNMLAGQISNLVKYPIKKAPSRAKRKVKNNSIVYSMVRPNQLHYGIIKNPSKNFIVSTGFAVIDCLKDQADSKFIYYWLTQSFITEFLQSIAENSTSAYPAIRPENLENLEILLPTLEEQKRIAEILGAFDDKIELLQKQNKTLEEMAKAIFKSWFVDFDIVKAKQKGDKKEDIIKNYHLTEELYNLFPSSFEQSPLGPIPTGWKVDKLINKCTVMLGGTPSRLKKEYWENGTIPWIASGKVNDFRIATPSEYITQEGLNNSATKLMPKRTTVIAITGATLGQISLTEMKCCANQSVVSVLGDMDLFSEYIYFWIQNNINLLLSKQTGGAQQHINKNDVESLLVLVPSNNILKPYLQKVKPLFDKISNNIQQIKTLTELRDTLLPRLISGKIKV